MEPPSPVPAPARKRRSLRWIAFAAAVALVLVIAVLVAVNRPVEKFVWLTPTQTEQMLHPQPPSKIVEQLKSWVEPIVRRLGPNPTFIHLEATIVPLPPEQIRFATSGSPVATNANGMRAWFLSPDTWKELLDLPTYRQGSMPLQNRRPTFTCPPGVRAEFEFTQNEPPNDPGGALRMDVGMIPKTGSGTITTDISFALTRWSAFAPSANWSVGWSPIRTNASVPPPVRPPALKTNYVVACRAVIPDGGALLVQCGSLRDNDGVLFWFIAAPTTNSSPAGALRRR